jgi:hypothetical protein
MEAKGRRRPLTDVCGGIYMTTVKAITAAIAELPPDQVAQIRGWLNERDEAEWDAQIERDERAGRLDALADRALAEYRAGRTRPL